MASDFWVWFEGQEGIERRACYLSGSDRVNLDQFDEIRVHIAAKANTALLVDVAIVPDADQVSEVSETEGKGWATYTVESTGAAIAAKSTDYLVSLIGMTGDVPEYFPTRRDGTRTFGKLRVHDPLGIPAP